jgi:transposase
MRYPQGGGLTEMERLAREQRRMEAAALFERGAGNEEIAAGLRVSVRSVQRWQAAWRVGGKRALASKGPASLPRISAAQFARLEAELRLGPAAHGWADQVWTLGRVKTLIGRTFHIPYTVQGVWKLMRRHGWSWQSPARRAAERDEAAITLWKKEVWPRVKQPRRPLAPGSCSKTNPGRR